MAEQARKFGQRIAERRDELGLEQKDVVARMVELGDKGINTNQVSRYEGGEGPMPRETRLEAFATALETTVADLLAGDQPKPTKTPDLLRALNGDGDPYVREALDEIRSDIKDIISRLDAAAASQAATAQLEDDAQGRTRKDRERDATGSGGGETPPAE